MAAQTPQVQYFQPGFRLIDGQDLNNIFNGSLAVVNMTITTLFTTTMTLTTANLTTGNITTANVGTLNLTNPPAINAAAAGNNPGTDYTIAGGAATGTGNNSSVVLTAGTGGSGLAGAVIQRSLNVVHQGAAAALTTSALLTTAQLLGGLLTGLQGGGASAAYQLPDGTVMGPLLPADFAVNDAFDFSLINISTTAAESASITTNTNWTLVGDMDVAANSAATTKSAGRFRVRMTAANTFTLYRLS
jgi:hypothetical protein